MMSLNDITTELCVLIECVSLILYSNGIMRYRESRAKSNLIIILGYLVIGALCLLYIPVLNIISFIAITFIVLYMGFAETPGRIVLNVIILTVFMMFTELIGEFILSVNISEIPTVYFVFGQDMLYSLVSKTLYFVFVITLKRFSSSKKYSEKVAEVLLLLPLPICTCGFLYAFDNMRPNLNYEAEMLFLIISFMLIAANFIVYIVFDRIIDKNIQIKRLREIESKNKTDFESYRLIKDKYDELKIMVHDFNKYCANIEAMLSADQTEALSLIHKIEDKNKEFLLVEYTNNKALNILLSQKMKECSTEDIEFQIYIQDIDISFISEADIVAIFANLLDNAIESCKISENKKIFLSIYDMNSAFVVIKADNSADTEPAVEDGKLLTRKKDKAAHGIGILSIKQTLKNYDGKIRWSYDGDKRVFNTTIIINYQAIKNNI